MRGIKFFVLSSVLFYITAPSYAADNEKQTTIQSQPYSIKQKLHTDYNHLQIEELHTKAMGGDPSAQFYLARRLQKGIGIARNSQQAVKWYTASAKNGAVPAQLNLGLMYTFGDGILADEALARYWLEKAVQGKDNRGSYTLAMLDEKQNNLIAAYSWYMLSTQDEMLSEEVKSHARGKIGKLTPILSLQDIDNARVMANSWMLNH